MPVATTRTYTGSTPPAPQPGMMWHPLDGEHWIEIQDSFVDGVNAYGEQAEPGLWDAFTQQATAVARDANGASQGQISKWIWPGIPIIFTTIKFVAWVFGRGRR